MTTSGAGKDYRGRVWVKFQKGWVRFEFITKTDSDGKIWLNKCGRNIWDIIADLEKNVKISYIKVV